ncbi:hypothetical protein ASG11_02220 [Sphingomonas sp. Leaf357]|uniref:DUF1491 family protein n=1 Tax=Sphingomonas sp. Leaf357 TaxID=1736350 RepID=UPI0006F80582|nr:DUF1491 family protein [Sphingomonas sp. Leaf357]KQS03218.1 hypothetical protein ASG11_02220 [Sphingomonas sp. Leaf357]
MSARLPSAMLVSALLRRVNDAGGMGMMLARGDSQGGGILIIALENNANPRALERGIGPDGQVTLIAWTPPDREDRRQITDYWLRRRQNDPDLWVIELDIPFVERFAAETILAD